MLLTRIANYITEKALTAYLYESRFIGTTQSHIILLELASSPGALRNDRWDFLISKTTE